ncbi:hypothetical protein O181_107371 [Austropuccinia psidii MF-1]|uniref:Uncharacterized protein n=1 Tax=Austropuccinia psidii MF-1 TaxID=1389203 RepID=A0A9Q3JT82_9BASI|nr:hypothetical protein [Austropuccinia psidii MF-1]
MVRLWFLADLGPGVFLAIFGNIEIGGKIGSGGPTCGLGPTWPWGLVVGPLTPFWSKGAQGSHRPWPGVHSLQPAGCRGHSGLKWPKKAIQALDPIIKWVGQKALVMARGARSPWKYRWTPRPKNKGIGPGLVRWSIGQKGQWLQDIACGHNWQVKGGMAQRTYNTKLVQLAINLMT